MIYRCLGATGKLALHSTWIHIKCMCAPGTKKNVRYLSNGKSLYTNVCVVLYISYHIDTPIRRRSADMPFSAESCKMDALCLCLTFSLYIYYIYITIFVSLSKPTIIIMIIRPHHETSKWSIPAQSHRLRKVVLSWLYTVQVYRSRLPRNSAPDDVLSVKIDSADLRVNCSIVKTGNLDIA